MTLRRARQRPPQAATWAVGRAQAGRVGRGTLVGGTFSLHLVENPVGGGRWSPGTHPQNAGGKYVLVSFPGAGDAVVVLQLAIGGDFLCLSKAILPSGPHVAPTVAVRAWGAQPGSAAPARARAEARTPRRPATSTLRAPRRVPARAGAAGASLYVHTACLEGALLGPSRGRPSLPVTRMQPPVLPLAVRFKIQVCASC